MIVTNNATYTSNKLLANMFATLLKTYPTSMLFLIIEQYSQCLQKRFSKDYYFLFGGQFVSLDGANAESDLHFINDSTI